MRVVVPYIGRDLSVNYYKVVGRGGRPTHATKPVVVGWQLELVDRIKEEAGYEELFGQPVVVRLSAVFKDRRQPDLHNLHKVIADSVAPALGVNDRYLKFVDGDVRIDWERDSVLILEIEGV